MKSTRRQFLQSTITSVALLAIAQKAFAQTAPASGSASANASPLAPSDKVPASQTSWVNVNVSDGSTMRMFVARPEWPAGKLPAVLVLQEVFGVNDYIQDVTQRIAKLGYVAAAPELFHRTAPGFAGDYNNIDPAIEQMKKMTDAQLEADLHAVYDFLTHDAQVDAGKVASVGYCMGGRASFFANAVLPLQAAVSYYGAGISPALLPRAKDEHGPLLLFWGGKDTHIGRDQQDQVAQALRAAGKIFSDVEFSDAEHGFFCDRRKSYNASASLESWALFTAFLKEHLGAPAA